MVRLCCSIALLLVFPAAVLAQGGKAKAKADSDDDMVSVNPDETLFEEEDDFRFYRPQLKNDKGGPSDFFPMGVLSATGRVDDKSPTITVTHIGLESLAEKAGLKVGDVIVGVAGQRFSPYSRNPDTGFAGPQTALAAALNRFGGQPDRTLTFEVIREGEAKPLKLSVELPECPSFAKTFPRSCPKRDKYLKEVVDYLVERQRNDGSWKSGAGGDSIEYTTAFCGLAILAYGNPEHLPNLKRAIQFLRRKGVKNADPQQPQRGPKNWIAAASSIFMAEYYLATGDNEILPDLERCCAFLGSRVAPNGRMGHHFEITYGGGGLTIVNVHAHLAWALAHKCGCKIDQAAWNRSMVEIGKALTKNGALGYSSRAKGDNDAPARTGGMATALVLADSNLPQVRMMGLWLTAHEGRLPMAHTNASMGLIFGTMGIRAANPAAYDAHMRYYLPYFELTRGASGPAMYFGNKGNFGGDQYLGLNHIGNATVALMLASADGKLFLFGQKQANWLNKVTEEPEKDVRPSTKR